jgi:radical SAM protein with 4Fe4S-binding SPASM domain
MEYYDENKYKTFCILPWIHLYVNPNGEVYTCCLTPYDPKLSIGNLKKQTLEQIWNSDLLLDIRKKMLNNQHHSNCNVCYIQEKNNILTNRIEFNKKYYNRIDDLTKNTNTETGYNSDFKLLYWDFRFTNLCNFKCRMCYSGLSSAWYKDEIKLFGRSNLDTPVISVNDYSIEDIFLYIDKFIDDVDEIYFAGGEPLIMDEHYLILEKLIERGRCDVKLRYNTNLSKLEYKNWNIFDLWKHFNIENINLDISIDGYGKLGEYIRKGMDWKKMETNIKKCLDFLHNSVNINITPQLLNIHHIPDLLKKLIDMGVNENNIFLYNILTGPKYYSINILPKSEKEKLLKKYNNFLMNLDTKQKNKFKNDFSSIFSFMNDRPSDSEQLIFQFKDITIKLDKIRNESYKEVLGDMIEWVDGIPNKKII